MPSGLVSEILTQFSAVEEVAFRRDFIDARQLERLGQAMGKTDYGRYLAQVAREGR